MKKNLKIAICYDFDGTLSPVNMQEVDFIPMLGLSPKEYWDRVGAEAKKNNMDLVLAYLNFTIRIAKENNIPLTKDFLRKLGKNIPLFSGVKTWFKRINEYALNKKITIEHYIISSGIEEMIKGSQIASEIKHIFACQFVFKDNVAIAPATVINYTNKTQHLFRINKGIFNYYENAKLNQFTPQAEKYIPFTNMLYIGDGETDVPSMKIVMSEKGHAIAVYDDEPRDLFAKRLSSKEIAQELFIHKRTNFIAPADYSKGSALENIVKTLIDKIEADNKCEEIRDQIKSEIKD